MGVHFGEVVVRKNRPEEIAAGAKPLEVGGLAVAVVARISSLAQAGQTLLSRTAFDLARRASVGADLTCGDLRWVDHGPYRFKGVADPVQVCEVGGEGIARLSAPPDSETAQRDVAPGDEETLGWRPAPGLAIPGREGWKLERRLGVGGFGEVWLAEQQRTHEQRAFKFCFHADRLRGLERELTLFRLMKESLGDRADIGRLYDVQLERAPFYLETEYCAAGNLASWAERQGGIEKVPLETRMELVAQIAEALSGAHSAGVIHKDVKPTNVLIHENPDGTLQAKLSDFGTSQIVGLQKLREAGVTAIGFTRTSPITELGSPAAKGLYISPESLTGQSPTVQSDIYALGVLLYQIMVGDLNRPLAEGWERGIDSAAIRYDIAACVASDPAKRLSDAGELARRLRLPPELRAAFLDRVRNEQDLIDAARQVALGPAADGDKPADPQYAATGAECLTPAEIEGLLTVTVAPENKARAEAHLANCSQCRALVERYRSDNDLLDQLQQLGPPETIAGGGGGEPRHATTPPSGSFPGYEITREIHRGGQGVVYQAIQISTKRRVAIKVMKEGAFASAADKARFEREVAILAQLRHPHIVTVHDSGTASGSFYFVMDYISGQSLDAYMDGGEHTVEDTLKLFVKICEAVNTAHLQGVVHRDLKPGNIRIDVEGEPRILDFGLAKVPAGQVAGGSRPQVMTTTGEFIGSLPWASPEQAEGIPSKIDIRTDVYSLGVIFYQMLTGKFPYEVIGNIRNVMDSIMKAEPARPSTIRRQINDEVETLVLKCLRKERERRYQSAGELARDIRHYLAGEPIEAKRDSVWYVLRKQLNRYRRLAMVVAAFVVLISGFGINLFIQARREARHLRQEQATKALLDIYEQLVEAVSDGILVVDANSLDFIEANDGATVLLGYSHEALLTMNLKEISSNPDRLERGESVPRTVQMRLLKRKDGSTFPAEIRLQPFAWDGRQQVFAIIRDLSAGERPQYEQLTDELFDKWVFSDDVIAVLEADSSFDSHIRRSAIARAQAKGDVPHRLHEDARRLVRHPGGDPQVYSIARRAAEAAAHADPTNGIRLTTLAVAQYRLELYDESLATLLRSDELNGASAPADAAFLAMTYQRLGRIDEAMAAFGRLEDLMGQDQWKDHDEAHASFREARSVVVRPDASRDVETPAGLPNPSGSPGSGDHD